MKAREAKRKARETQSGLIATESQNKGPANETETANYHEFETDGHANEAEVAVGAEVAVLAVEDSENCPNVQDDRGRAQIVLKRPKNFAQRFSFLNHVANQFEVVIM